MDEIIIKFIEKLIDCTKSGKLNWEETACYESFSADIYDMSVIITRTHNDIPYKEDNYFLQLLDCGGIKDVITVEESSHDYPLINQLYQTARFNALGIKVHLENLIKQLDAL